MYIFIYIHIHTYIYIYTFILEKTQIVRFPREQIVNTNGSNQTAIKTHTTYKSQTCVRSCSRNHKHTCTNRSATTSHSPSPPPSPSSLASPSPSPSPSHWSPLSPLFIRIHLYLHHRPVLPSATGIRVIRPTCSWSRKSTVLMEIGIHEHATSGVIESYEISTH